MYRFLKYTTRFLFSSVLIIFITGVLFAAIEGGLQIYKLIQTAHVHPKMKHIEYDPLLGWTNIPNHYVPGMFFETDYFQSNSQGFRSKEDFTKEVPENMTRIICSGDSFTMGVGVDNDHAWCELLAKKSPHLQTINMGQGGYGLDQAYLWYMRDGIKFDHQIHIFAFIPDDFNRIRGASYANYPKPYFSLVNDELVLKNVPVPHHLLLPIFRNLALANFNTRLYHLRYMETAKQLVQFYDQYFPAPKEDVHQGDSYDLPFKIFRNLQEENRKHGRQIIFVFLPPPNQSKANEEDHSKNFRHELAKRMKEHGMHYLDLTDDFKKEVAKNKGLYIYDGHLNNEGNKLAAEMLYQKIARLNIYHENDQCPYIPE